MHSIQMLGVVALISRPAALAAQAPQPPSDIVTVGTAEATLPPSRARVRVAVETHAPTAAAAASQSGERSRAIRDAVRGLGLKVDSVRISSFMVMPNYDFQRGRKLVDYQARSTVEFTVRELERIGAVLDAALGGGATEVPSMMFESDSIDAVRRGLLSRALQEARADAEPIARAGGGRLGRLLSASTETEMPRPRMAVAMGVMAAQAGAPDVEGEVRASVRVETRWEFVPGPP